MSRHGSRLSILVFLVLLYASPLSSGDKGLWLSVAAIPVPLFGTFHGAMPAEHSILLPSRSGLGLARVCIERGEAAPGPGLLVADETTIAPTWTTVSHPSAWTTLESICPAPSAPRGPPS
jgi:hypothetical protein